MQGRTPGAPTASSHRNLMTQADRKFFTVDEANRRLPLVRSIVRDIMQLSSTMRERRQRMAKLVERSTVAGCEAEEHGSHDLQEIEQLERQLRRDPEQLEDYRNELAAIGAELEDPVRGIAAFPTVIDGRDAVLCWEAGQEEIIFWREPGADYRSCISLLEGFIPSDPADEPDGNFP